VGDTLVIGAGSSGLAAAKALRLQGFDVDLVEREPEVGGNWNFAAASSRVYANTHMISSKPFTQFPDFPMADADPDYLHHERVLAYLQRYATHFGLTDVLRTSTEVEAVVPLPDGGFDVTLRSIDEDTTETHRYERVVVANGHNWYPKEPSYPGRASFEGDIVHSAEVKDPALFDGRRVVVVGAGNTGCDLAVEAAQRADVAWHSTRRAYWYAPKYALGRPADQVSDLIFALRLPTRATQWLFELTAKLVVGRYERFGLPTPDHRFLETHPIINQTLLYHVGHGDLLPVPDLARFEPSGVVTTDGRHLDADLVVFATGYLIRFPFLSDDVVPWDERGRPLLYRNILHPDRDDLGFVGLIQPDSGQFALVHWQSELLARTFALHRDVPWAGGEFSARAAANVEVRSQGGVQLVDSTRHLLEVEHLDYLRALAEDLALLDRLRQDAEVAA
jgi:cation diffusion facilitator CzcD-associated flavoprotein CzcO